MNNQDTIVAIATPSGMGAIAVLRLSGVEAIAIVSKVFFSKKKDAKNLSEAQGYTIHFGEIRDNNHLVDEVLVSIFRAPNSYTGEDTVEVSCHGSVYIQQALLQLFLRNGARMAEAGEFTMRSFFNGKMDLSQAEAVADLIHSENAASAQVALSQMRGGFSQELAQLREELITFASLIELELDFSEEDVEFANRAQLTTLLENIRRVLVSLSESFALGNVIKNGIPVAIVGAPNAGKSTLLNALLREERAIVSEIAGTTRDTIEDEIQLGGLTFRFIDTAGLRDTTDQIESIGIRKAYEKIDQAQIVVFIYDASRPESEIATEYAALMQRTRGKSTLVLANKSDLVNGQSRPSFLQKNQVFITLAAAKNEGVVKVTAALVNQVETAALSNNQVVVTNARHYQNLIQALSAVDRIREGMDAGISGDFLALDVREALRYLGNITGAIEVDRDILGSIFGKFCIGK
ncbi:MAG: tRNA uridine-5-carboxymethylaminomethyl(34) synthesis GTPase MnmE [Cryomorphaceae bacterium]|nr:tRNA uridine-5-carboxymethylaminomethyl(34) synthesis GTPase MnmE [Cryomorphaceae bacterium]